LANGKKGVGGKLASKGAGIFGKAASELFELPVPKGKRAHFLRPVPPTHERAKKYRLPPKKKGETRPIATYQKAGKEQQDLRDAVNQARIENKDTGGNYAAYRYIDKDGNEGILVARSGQENEDTGGYKQYVYHSEQQGGSFLLDQMKEGNVVRVTEVYTERSPCNVRSQQCGAWLYEYFQKHDSNFKVTYDELYDTAENKAKANAAIKAKAIDLLKKGSI